MKHITVQYRNLECIPAFHPMDQPKHKSTNKHNE